MKLGVTMMVLSTIAALLGLGQASGQRGDGAIDAPMFLYEIPVNKIDGTETTLKEYEGEVLLIVNVASKCGFTNQYKGLQALYETYQDQGFQVLGFPANNFLNQEPGTNEQIAAFCEANFGVTFPMFEKISVKGADMHPLYQHLTSKQLHPDYGGDIGWNFTKFVVSRDGRLVGRFGSRTGPDHEALVGTVERALAAPTPEEAAKAKSDVKSVSEGK